LQWISRIDSSTSAITNHLELKIPEHSKLQADSIQSKQQKKPQPNLPTLFSACTRDELKHRAIGQLKLAKAIVSSDT
jgi:hypothetical protein